MLSNEQSCHSQLIPFFSLSQNQLHSLLPFYLLPPSLLLFLFYRLLFFFLFAPGFWVLLSSHFLIHLCRLIAKACTSAGMPEIDTQILNIIVLRSRLFDHNKMSKSERYLRYGQRIRIHGNQPEKKQGLVVVKGFTDLDARYMTFAQFTEIKNYREGLFQILPKGIFEIHEELHKSNLNQDQSQRATLVNRAKIELEQYYLLIDSKMGEYIYFGEDVIFLHVDSGAYLSGSVQCSDGGLGSFKVELSQGLSSMLVFKLLPFRSYQKQGDKITLECPLRIKNMKNRCYLSIQMDQKLQGEKQTDLMSDRRMDFAKVLPEGCVRFNVVTTYSQSQTWIIHLHESHATIKDIHRINTHDIVYLVHTQNQGFLTSCDGKLILKQPLMEDPMLFSALWQFQQLPQPPTAEKCFCLRQLLSGNTIGLLIDTNLYSHKKREYTPVLFDSTKPVIIRSVKGGDLQEMRSGSLVKIALPSNQTVFQLDAQQNPDKSKPEKEKLLTGREFFSKDLQYENRGVLSSDSTNEIDHGFRMIKIDQQTQRQVLYALSSHQILFEFQRQVSMPGVDSTTRFNYLNKINNTIEQLIAFIQNSSVSEIKEERFKPIKKRQIIFKDLKICDIFFRILEMMGRRIREQVYKKIQNEHEIFKCIFRNGYVLIYKIIMDNLTTKLYVSEWINTIITQAIEIDQNMIHITLNEILSANEVVVSKYLSKSIIQKLVDIFINQPPHEKYIKILRSSCICGALPILNNQNNILEQYFGKIKLMPEIFFKFQEKQNSIIKLYASISKKSARLRTLFEFHKNSNEIDVKQTWHYFISCLNLIADVCFGRNQKAKASFVRDVELSHMCLILQDEDVKQIGMDSKDLLRAILRIINYLFVDTVGQDSINRMSRIRHYQTIEQRTDISRIQIEQKDLTRVLDFLAKRLNGFESFESTDIKELEFFLTILQLLRSTLISGYWENLERLSQMVPCLLKIMKNQKNKILEAFERDRQKPMTEQMQQRAFECYKENILKPVPQNQLIIKCKLLATELLQIIFDFEIDVRVSQITVVFKRIHQHPQLFRPLLEPNDTLLFSPSLWKDQLVKLFNSSSVLSKVNQSEVNYNIVFMQLSQHRNPQLLAKSLKILKRIIDKRSETISNFLKISLYCEGEAKEKANCALEKRKKLAILNDQNMLTANQLNQASFHYKVWDEQNGLIQDLYKLSQSLKSKPSGLPIKLQYLNPQNQLHCFYNQRQNLRSLTQNIIKSTEIHRQLLNYVILCKKEKLAHMGSLAKKLLHSVYIFLSLLVKNNIENKREIMSYRNYFLEHIHINVGAIDLLWDIFLNNKKLLYAQQEIEQITIRVVSLIKQMRMFSYYMSKLLDFFRCFLFCNDKVIFYNATLIMSKLQDQNIRKIPYYFTYSQLRQQLQNFEVCYERVLESNQARPMLTISEGLTYVTTVFSLFSNLIQQRNKVNIGKSKQVHDYYTLLDLLQKSNNCWPLKRSLRAYVNRLYYIQNNYQSLCDFILQLQVPLFIQDLDKIIEIKLLKEDLFKHIELTNSVRFKYLETYLYLYLQEILVSINETFNNQFFIRKLDNQLSQNYFRGRYYLHFYIIRIYERLACLKNIYRNNRLTKSFITSLLNNLKNSFLNNFAKSHSRIFDKNQEGKVHDETAKDSHSFRQSRAIQSADKNKHKDNAEQLRKRSDVLVKRLMLGQINSYFVQKKKYFQANRNNYPLTFLLPEKDASQVNLRNKPKIDSMQLLVDKIKSLFEKDEKRDSQKSERLNWNLKKVEEVMMSGQFRMMIEEEFKLHSQKLFINDAVSVQFYGFHHPYISLKEWIKTIVHTNSIYTNALSTDLKVFFFKLMRHYVQGYLKDQQDSIPIDTWDNDHWSSCEKQIQEAQEFLQDCGVAEYLCECLKQNLQQKLELANQILLFGIAFLLGGNLKCQMSILVRLKQDRKNQVFVKLQSLISHIGRTNYNNFKLRRHKKNNDSKFFVNMFDNYDYFDVEKGSAERMHIDDMDSNRDDLFKQLCVVVFRRIFRFMQLLCQNNNIESKNFIRCQVDADNSKKINSINFIEITTFEVRKIFKIMNKQIVELPMFLLDFINEVCQIPCEANQTTLCSTTFFQDVCYMASFLSVKENQSERNFLLINKKKLQQLYDIYLKCIQIILSVFEGNDKEIDEQLATKVEFKFLIDVVKYKLQEMRIGNAADIRNYFQNITAKRLDKSIIDVINVLIILRRLCQKEPSSRLTCDYNQFKLRNPDQYQTLSIIEEHICNIELVIQKKKQKVYFPLHPVFGYLSYSTRDKIMAEVKRQTQREKLVGIISKKNQIFKEIQHNHFLSQNTFMTLPLSNVNVERLYSISTFLSILINLIFLFQHEVDIYHFKVQYLPVNSFFDVSISLLSVFQLIFTVLYIVGWWRVRSEMSWFRQDRERLAEGVKKKDKSPDSEEFSLFKTISKPFLKFAHKLDSLLGLGRIKLLSAAMGVVQMLLANLLVMIKHEEEFINAMVFLLVSILGTFYKKYFFMIHQFSIFSRINVLQNVFQAIAYNAKQLVIVSSLGIVFVYVFSLIGFQHYVKTVYEEYDNYCTSVIECILSLYISGAIGGGMQQFKLVRFFYDILYFIFFGLLFGNIISGIMIDTFAQLRDHRNQIQKDKKNLCFICGIGKATLEKQNNNFQTHTRQEHFLWNYVFFLYELREKSKVNYTGIQYYINQLSTQNVIWIPSYEEEGKSHTEEIDRLDKHVTECWSGTDSLLKKIESDVELLKNKLSQ